MRRFVPQLEEHLTDDRLADLACDLLPLTQKAVARQHLASCLPCRVRQARLERRAEDVTLLYTERARSIKTPRNRDAFLKRVDDRLAAHVPCRRWSFRKPMTALPNMLPITPALATSVILGVAAILSLVIWQQQRIPRISSNSLLVRAERWDTANFAERPTVVYQAVKIRAGKQTTERRIYRDAQGKRQPKDVKLTAADAQLRGNFAAAGVDWDEPLSAANYQRWHDSQHVREDEITREGRHLLTLTTETPDGPVKAQTLTVRDTDFHPVRRTIAFRDSDTVEIAELEFKLLPWSSVDMDIFQPLGTVETAASETAARVIPFRLPVMPTPQQLDEAELSVRLVLNHLHADTGEQIQVSRTAQGVQVAGVVDTEERKGQIQMQLRAVPYVAAKIQSLTDISNGSGKENKVASAAMGTTLTAPSPLETYLVARKQSLPAITELAQKLNSSAVAISQESRAIHDLQTQFSSAQHRSMITSATLTELVFSHRERLQQALKEEHNLLRSMMDSDLPAVASGSASLTDMADKNLALCAELTASGTPKSRGAHVILTEIAASLEQLTADSHDFQDMPQSGPALSGKR
jgi:hypothetical protein